MTCTQQDDIFICDDLIDVWSFSTPQSYGDPVPYGSYLLRIPTIQYLQMIEPGDEIKVSRGIEKIWTRVISYDGHETIIGVIISELTLDHPFSVGDKIQYQFRNVYEVKKK